MLQPQPLDEAAFQYLVSQAGISSDAAHLAELLPYVRHTLASLQSVRDLDVTGTEPDLAFIPRRGE